VSALQVGSTFTLHLPTTYAGAEATPHEPEGQPATAHDHTGTLPPDADFGGLKVLLVDDDMRNLFAIRTVLEARGIVVLHAENGRLALELLQGGGDVDLVLMDTMMPEMDGLTATRAIRAISRFQSLPIISLTAKAMMGDREKALAAGASDYVTKPVDPEKLLAVIHGWQDRRHAGPRA
jgi:CheY-like chemotaxis protein